MTKHRLVSWGAVCAVTLAVAAAGAQAPARPSDKGHGHGHEEGHGNADSDHDKGDHDKGDRDKGGDEDKPGAAALGHGHRHAMHELFEELRSGKLKKQDVKARLAKLETSRVEREAVHREELKARWGSALATPAAREELEHHARRVARLDRAMLLVETEVSKDRNKLNARIEKLQTQEEARHQHAMERLRAMPTTTTPSATVAPAASEKAGEK